MSDSDQAGVWQVEVLTQPGFPDAAADLASAALDDGGLGGLEVASVRITLLSGVDRAAAERIAGRLLADPVTERWALEPLTPPEHEGAPALTVRRKAGVMDPATASVEGAIRALGHQATVGRATRYHLRGEGDLSRAATLVANDTIEEVLEGAPRLTLPASGGAAGSERVEVPLRELDRAALEQLSLDLGLALDSVEMEAIAAHYRELGREPSDVELETLAQTWSEHCVHKTLTHPIRYQGPDGERRIGNLLKETIKAATDALDRDWCVSVFVDNAGIVEFADGWHVCIKVETHNHPSAIEPYGGAGTGTGGVVRDILGTGRGALPILCTDVFCLGPLELADADVPPGSLHPRRVLRGVVGGVRDYGNRLGIPTGSGALYFDPDYVGNPLVYAGCVGILPADRVEKVPQAGDRIVVVGGRTGRDGIKGATFSSVELTDQSEVTSSGAVQIGNPIEEKKLIEALVRARDADLYTCVTDCGAGGLSSAVGEMGEHLGADVNLDLVPLKYDGLSYAEVWISEAQERMVLAVPPDKLEALLAICAAESCEATDIGHYTGDGQLRLHWRGNLVADIGMAFLHDGLPKQEREARWQRGSQAPLAVADIDVGATLLALLAAPNIASKQFVVRQYDHEVQATSVLKPLVGVEADADGQPLPGPLGPGDAVVLQPLPDVERGLAVAKGCNPRLGRIDPYRMSAWGIDEAIRNVVAVGADPERICLLDNFSWGNCKDPEQLGLLVEAALACKDMSLAFGAPFVSGKDSLNNEFHTGAGERRIIPPTLLITAMAPVPDLAVATSSDLKRPGNTLVQIGETGGELGGSHLAAELGLEGGVVPPVDLVRAPKLARALHAAIRAGHVRACHDLSEGGLAVAAAEMAIGGGLGAVIDAGAVPCSAPLGRARRLFAESATRWLVEVEPGEVDALLAHFEGLPAAVVGEVTAQPGLVITDGAAAVADLPLADLVHAFSSLDRRFGWEPVR